MDSWDVEIWHDTTMWNEGLDRARVPFVTLSVPTEQSANEIAEWVDATYALATRSWEDNDKAFTARTHPTARLCPGAFAVVNLAHAKVVVPGLLARWRGL